jgi:hypothetical protein
MNIFFIPSSIIDDIEMMLNYFSGNIIEHMSKEIHWMSWERLIVHNHDGGMDFKSYSA